MRTHRRWLAAWGAVMAWCGVVVVRVDAQTPPPAAAAPPIEFRWSSHDVYVTPPGGPVSIQARNRSSKVIVSYGVRVFTRDGRARLVPADSYVVRPRYAFGPQLAQPLALRVPGEPPAYELRATFALFDDGTWWGSPDRARREIETIREEFDVLSALSQSLVAAGEAPTRDDVRAISARCARQLAAARTRGARRQLEDVMRRLAVGLDDSRAEPAALVLAVVRDRVERALARYEPLGFVRRPPYRG